MSILDKVTSVKTVLSVLQGILQVLVKCCDVILDKVEDVVA